jgi:hypothetical protein
MSDMMANTDEVPTPGYGLLKCEVDDVVLVSGWMMGYFLLLTPGRRRCAGKRIQVSMLFWNDSGE